MSKKVNFSFTPVDGDSLDARPLSESEQRVIRAMRGQEVESTEFQSNDLTWCRICRGSYPEDRMWKHTHDGYLEMGPFCFYCCDRMSDSIKAFVESIFRNSRNK